MWQKQRRQCTLQCIGVSTMKTTRFCTMTFFSLIAMASSWAQCPDDGGLDYGQPMGVFMSVVAYSNGNYTEQPCVPGYQNHKAEYQCVELARRFAAEYHNRAAGGFSSVVCGANMWNELQRDDYGYQAILNNSDTKPRVGDFVIWWTTGWSTCDDGSGHVAIVCWVGNDGILVFEQNINSDSKPFRWVPRDMSVVPKWKLNNGERLGSSFFVKGWLRYPGFKVPVGMYFDGRYDQKIKEKGVSLVSQGINLKGYDDGAGPFVHLWEPFGYPCQNVIGGADEQGIIIYDHQSTSETQAHLISGEKWEFYRKGCKDPVTGFQRFGPDIPLGDGTTVGVPTTDEINDTQIFKGGYCSHGSVNLYRPDGTLVYTYDPTGEFSELTLHGKQGSENHNVLGWLGGPPADKYLVFADDVQIGETTNNYFTEAGLLPGTTRRYRIVAWSSQSGILESSNEVTVVTPGDPGSFAMQGAADGYTGAYLQWQNTAYPYAPFYWLFRDGVKVAKLVSDFDHWTDRPLLPNHRYIYQLAAITASELVLGWSNPVTVT